MVNNTEIGLKIRELRIKAGLSQEKLAAHLEITFQQVQKYERGITKVNLERLQQLAEILKVPVASFFEESKSKVYDLSENEMALLTAFREIKDGKSQQSLIYIADRLSKIKI